MKECDAVFEGGGVKGIGLVGAVCALEKAGYVFKNVAGSSAGSIVAALLAAGFNCRELIKELSNIDYTKLKGKDFLDYFGLFGKLLSLSKRLGIYNINYLKDWLEPLLASKKIFSFGDLPGYSEKGEEQKYIFGKNKCRLQVTVTDLKNERLLILPDDLSLFGVEPESFSIAKAVCMSCSIPLFYEPSILYNENGCLHYLVDGGLLSNYPIWILDDGTNQFKRPVFGLRFIETVKKACITKDKKLNLFDYIKTIISTTLDANDAKSIENIKGSKESTIFIPTSINLDGKHKKIGSIDFDLTNAESRALFKNGYCSAKKFLCSWDFEKWKKIYRT